MIPVCEVEAPVAVEVQVVEEALRGDAACMLPVGAEDTFAPDPTRAEVRLVSPEPVWITVDGVVVPLVSPRPLDVTVRLAPGAHLFEVGGIQDFAYAVTLAHEVEAGGWTAMAVVPTLDGTDVVICEDGLFGGGDLLAVADLGPGGRRWVSERFGAPCIARSELSFPVARAQAVVAARTGWTDLAHAARDRAMEADLQRFEAWQHRELRTAAWLRGGELAGLGSYLAIESLLVSKVVPEAREFAIGWGGRAALMGMLTSSMARRQALVRSGEPTPKASMILSGLALALSALRLPRPEERPDAGWSGGARLAAAGLGLVQIIEHERAQRRARRR